jgi:hypothetical protein
MPKRTKASNRPIKDFSGFTVVEVFKGKPLTGADPVLLSLIKKAAKAQ